MTPLLLSLLVDPHTKAPLTLAEGAITNAQGHILTGELVSPTGVRYPIVRGIPRFVPQEGPAAQESVESFGDQWNFFNYNTFRENWADSMRYTWGSTNVFKGKVVVDAGGGAGMQTKWISDCGAAHVICLELSHAVDGIISHNLKGTNNIDIIQCSIDAIPLKTNSIPGLVICHNVIQHTPSVAGTAAELWRITGEGAECAFNVYTRTSTTVLHKIRNGIYRAVRAVVSRFPWPLRYAYGHLMSTLRFIPGLGTVLEKMDLVRRGPLPPSLTGWQKFKFAYRAGVLNTCDYFGAHAYQHHLTYEEIGEIAKNLQPDTQKILNPNEFFSRPQPIGIMLRIKK